MKKTPYVDDGHTIYNMDGVDELYRGRRKTKGTELTKKERKAAIKAAFAVYLPVVLGAIACFSAVAVLLYFWLI